MAEASKLPDEEPISMDDDTPLPQTANAPSAGKALGGLKIQSTAELKRPLNVTGAGATRLKVFHSKIAVSSLEFMETQINQWIDGSKIEVKSVGQVIGTMEGKIAVPSVIVFVWY